MINIFYVLTFLVLSTFNLAFATTPESLEKLENAISKDESKKILDLSGHDMRKYGSLIGSDLKGKLDFQNAKLSGANFSGMKIEGINFYGADLEGVNFSGADMTNVMFSNANLDGANFSGATFSSIKFGKSSAKKANFDKIDAQYVGFNNMDLTGSSFVGVKLDSVSFTRSVMDNVILKDSSLFRVSFEHLKSKNNFKTINITTESVSGLGWFR